MIPKKKVEQTFHTRVKQTKAKPLMLDVCQQGGVGAKHHDMEIMQLQEHSPELHETIDDLWQLFQ